MANTLGNDALSITETELRAFIGSEPDTPSKTRLVWSLSIGANLEVVHEGVDYPEPVRVYFEVFSFTEQFRDWTELTGQVIECPNSAEVGIDDSRPGFYLWGHHDVERGTIRFLEREGCNFRVTWDGCSAGYGEFSFDTWVVFQGVGVSLRYLDDEKPLDILAQHLEPEDFVPDPETFPHQMSVLFKPKLNRSYADQNFPREPR